MIDPDPARGAGATLRGWLSQLYFPALLDAATDPGVLESLAGRLGPRSTVDDPVHGRAEGMPAVRELLSRAAEWLASRGAAYAPGAVVLGVDRDVQEGTVTLASPDGARGDRPVAVVAERRRAREVEVRVYGLAAERTGRAMGTVLDGSAPDPLVREVLAALARGDSAGIEAQVEAEGGLQDARGARLAKSDGALRRHLDARISGGAELAATGVADDGRICAVEYALARVGDRAVVPPRAGLLVLERGDSGLLRSLRFYGDLIP